MSDMDIYKEYIQDSIINRLERLMGNDVGDDVNLWEKYGSKGLTPQKDSVYRSMLHAMMVPYYNKNSEPQFRQFRYLCTLL